MSTTMGPTEQPRPKRDTDGAAGSAWGGLLVGATSAIWTASWTPLLIGIAWFFLCVLLAAAKNN